MHVDCCRIPRRRPDPSRARSGLFLLTLLLLAGSARAVGFDPVAGPLDPMLPTPTDPPCVASVAVQGSPRLIGPAVVGLTVTLDATHVKLFNRDPDCQTYRAPVDSWAWQMVVQPPGSTSTLEETATLQPTLLIDQPGSWTVRLSACSDTCNFQDPSGDIPVAATSRDFTFSTAGSLPPETAPVFPGSALVEADPFTRSDLERNIVCQNGGGVVDPQWVTVHEWAGPGDYAGGFSALDPSPAPSSEGSTVEGVSGWISGARVSSADARSNHYTQDANWNAVLDPRDKRFIFKPEGLPDAEVKHHMHNEWETGSYPGGFRPSAGDRVSMFGYWIHDCGHEPFKTEMHPPVGVATQRIRAIPLPEDQPIPGLLGTDGLPAPVGSNVWVPGVLTEVWFNQYAGKMKKCTLGGDTRLHQPATGSVIFIDEGDCIDDPSPLDALFTFDLYLPRSPQSVLEEAGVTDLPDVPLYVEVLDGSVDGSRVQFEPMVEGDVTYLRVTVDLRDQSLSTPWFRLAAAWVYPSPNNWRLRQWRLRIDSLNVDWDGDGRWRGEGEWNLWVQVNNAAAQQLHSDSGRPLHEWTRIVNQDLDDGCNRLTAGCGKKHDFGDRPWSTGNPDPERSLGPDLLLFYGLPYQRVTLHASGYEDDGSIKAQDSLGVINDLILAPEVRTTAATCGKFGGDTFGSIFGGSTISLESIESGGCAFYRMNYEVLDLGPVAPPQLSPSAQSLVDAYTFTGERVCPPGEDVGCPYEFPFDSLPESVEPPVWHPLDEVITEADAGSALATTELFEPQEVEEKLLMNMPLEEIYAEVVANPEEADLALRELRDLVDEDMQTLGSEVLLDVRALKAALPGALWQRHFGDLPAPETVPGSSRRRMTGSATILEVDGARLQVGLACDPVREPQKLKATWGKGQDAQRFELDLLAAVDCGAEDEPMVQHAGIGVGRLDGVPGATASWILEDWGEPSVQDHVRLVIRDDDVVVLDIDGPLDRGNLQTHDPLPRCGLGFESAFILLPAAWLARRRARRRAPCSGGRRIGSSGSA